MRENLGMEYHKLQCEKTSICTYSRCSEKFNTGKSRYCVSLPIRSRPIFFALDLTSALLHLVFPYQHRDLLSYTEFTFRLIDILNPISRFSRIVLDLRFTIAYRSYPLSGIEISFPIPNLPIVTSRYCIPFRVFLASHLTSALLYLVFPFQH